MIRAAATRMFALGTALGALAALPACGGASTGAPRVTASTAASSGTPTWERPGLGGAVRPEMGSPQPGEMAPELTLPDRDGHSVSLSSLRGNWVVLHFTATWCPFCDAEVAHLGELADAYGPRGVRTVIVDVEEKAAAWNAYAAKHVSPSVIALLDTSGASTSHFAPPRAQPSFEDRAQAVLDGTLIIDPQGRIRLFLLPDSAHFDPTFGGVRKELDRLLPEPTVTVTTAGPVVAAGAHAEVDVTLKVAPGYHVMSDQPSEPTYVPTSVEIAPAAGVTTGAPRYPVAGTFVLGERSIATFDGTVAVHVPVDVARDATPGDHRVHGTVRYQACTATRCLFPVSRDFDVALRVTDAR